MTKKKVVIVVCFVLFAILGLLTFKFFSTTQVSNTTRSGVYFGNQVWNGEITITGDTNIIGDLTILPGTIVRFEVRDDRGTGDEVPADGYNDRDPTRLKSYTTTHASIFVQRKLTAEGTKDKKITFTSAANNPNLADWESLMFQGDESILDNVIVEYSRNGINPIGEQQHSVIKNSIVRHTLWGAISSAQSTIQIRNNYLSDCGHEGVDVVHKGSQIIKGNTIEDCHAGIVVIGGSSTIEDNVIRNCGDGIGIDENSTPKLRNNSVALAPEGSFKQWRYGNFAYQLFGDPK